MAFSSGGKNGRTTMSEINVTPLVDVMLVLLIIFMVTAPLIQQGVKVDLPKTKAEQMEKDEKRLILSVDKDRRIFIGKEEIQLGELEEKLKYNELVKRDREVYLHADRRLPYGFVVGVMAIAKRAGVESLGMVTDPLDESGSNGNKEEEEEQ